MDGDDAGVRAQRIRRSTGGSSGIHLRLYALHDRKLREQEEQREAREQVCRAVPRPLLRLRPGPARMSSLVPRTHPRIHPHIRAIDTHAADLQGILAMQSQSLEARAAGAVSKPSQQHSAFGTSTPRPDLWKNGGQGPADGKGSTANVRTCGCVADRRAGVRTWKGLEGDRRFVLRKLFGKPR